VYRLSCNITIGDFVFGYVSELETDSSWQNLTDTCTIRLPRKLQFAGKSVKDLLRVGDAVTVQLGYDEELNTVFAGYLARIEPNIPLTLHCEDAMWLLKRNSVTFSLKEATLAQVLAAALPAGVSMGEVAALQIGNFRASKMSAAKVLDTLKEQYGLVSYMKGGKLNCGFAYGFSGLSPAEPKRFGLQENVASANLQYKLADDVRLKVKAISLKPDNTRTEVELGDEDGEQRTLHYYNLPEADLKKVAEADMQRLKYDGYKGSFTAFGAPLVAHGDVVALQDAEFAERNGSYYADRVKITFGAGGYRQEIELGKKALV